MSRHPVLEHAAVLWQRWKGTVAAAVTGLLAGVALLWLAVATQRRELGQALDQAGMEAVYGNAATARRLVGLLGNISLGTLLLVLIVLVGLAVLRQRYAAALAAFVLIAGANLTTQLLKRFVDRVDHGYLTVESLPSGHATVIASVVLAALLVAPERFRLVVPPAGSLAIILTGAATLVAGWHRPADILAALLVALIWGCLVVVLWGLLRRGSEPLERDEDAPTGALSLAGMVVAAVLLVAIGVRPLGGWPGLLDAGVVLGLIGLGTAGVVQLFADLSEPLSADEPGPFLPAFISGRRA